MLFKLALRGNWMGSTAMTNRCDDQALYPRSYRLPLSLIFSPIMGVACAVAAIVLTEKSDPEGLSVFVAIASTGALLISAALASVRYVLFPDRIKYLRPFKTIELKKTAIRGYCSEKRRKGLFLTLHPADRSRTPITVATSFFKPDAVWDAWMVGLPNLADKGDLPPVLGL